MGTLLDSTYPESNRPSYLTSDIYCQFSTLPDDGILRLPGTIFKTELRLMVAHEDWEYVVLNTELFSGARVDDRMLVSSVEFRSMNFPLPFAPPCIAYPLVSIRKDFIKQLQDSLHSNPESFRGLAL